MKIDIKKYQKIKSQINFCAPYFYQLIKKELDECEFCRKDICNNPTHRDMKEIIRVTEFKGKPKEVGL